MTTLNLVPELSKLLQFAGNVAGAIRMYSAYNPYGYSEGEFPRGRTDPARSPVDLMFLSDALTHLLEVGSAVERGKPEDIARVCDDVLRIYSSYEDGNNTWKHQAKQTLEWWGGMFDIAGAKATLVAIKSKAASM